MVHATRRTEETAGTGAKVEMQVRKERRGGYVQGIHEYEIAPEEPRVKGCCSYRLLPHG